MELSKVYRQRAADCRQLAAECSEPYVQDALRELAGDFARAAEELARSDAETQGAAERSAA